MHMLTSISRYQSSKLNGNKLSMNKYSSKTLLSRVCSIRKKNKISYTGSKGGMKLLTNSYRDNSRTHLLIMNSSRNRSDNRRKST